MDSNENCESTISISYEYRRHSIIKSTILCENK